MSASQSIHGACVSSSGNAGLQTRFADGTTKKTLKCTIRGDMGVISGRVTDCEGGDVSDH